jgi:homoserine O-acetyltransferase
MQVPKRQGKTAAAGRTFMKHLRAALSAVFALISFTAMAADYPAPKQGEWTFKDFKFHSGEVLPELRLH